MLSPLRHHFLLFTYKDPTWQPSSVFVPTFKFVNYRTHSWTHNRLFLPKWWAERWVRRDCLLLLRSCWTDTNWTDWSPRRHLRYNFKAHFTLIAHVFVSFTQMFYVCFVLNMLLSAATFVSAWIFKWSWHGRTFRNGFRSETKEVKKNVNSRSQPLTEA